MWKRFANVLRCSICNGALELRVLAENRPALSHTHLGAAEARGLLSEDFGVYVETGLLSCHRCKVWFPIQSGLPVLLPYTTPLHDRFAQENARELERPNHGNAFPSLEPVPGERFVLRSFSTEWLDYDFDGVI